MGITWSRWTTRLLPVVGLALLVLVLRSIDLKEAARVIFGANVVLVLLAALLVPLEVGAKSWKLQLLAGRRCSFGGAALVYLQGSLFGSISPGRVGDFVKVYAMGRYAKVALPAALAIVVIERLIEVLCLGLLTLAGILTLAEIVGIDPSLIALAAAALIVVAAAALMRGRRMARLAIGPLYRRLVAGRERQGFGQSVEAFRHGVDDIGRDRASFGLAVALSFGAWLITLLRCFVLSLALGIPVKFLAFILLYPIAIAAELLPISILGFGTREYTVSYLLGLLNVDVESAVVLSLLGFLVAIIPMTVGGFIALLLDTRRSRRMSRLATAARKGD